MFSAIFDVVVVDVVVSVLTVVEKIKCAGIHTSLLFVSTSECVSGSPKLKRRFGAWALASN